MYYPTVRLLVPLVIVVLFGRPGLRLSEHRFITGAPADPSDPVRAVARWGLVGFGLLFLVDSLLNGTALKRVRSMPVSGRAAAGGVQWCVELLHLRRAEGLEIRSRTKIPKDVLLYCVLGRISESGERVVPCSAPVALSAVAAEYAPILVPAQNSPEFLLGVFLVGASDSLVVRLECRATVMLSRLFNGWRRRRT